MANFSVKGFTSGIVTVIVGVILLVSVAIPIIGGLNIVGIENAESLKAIIGIIPILLAVSLIMAVISMFVSRRE